MPFTPAQVAIALIGLLHSLFALGELFGWGRPFILGKVLNQWKLDFQGKEENLVAMIVHNAGIYNGIVAAGLFVSLFSGPEAQPIQIALLVGGIVAGIFGAFTLTKATIVQAILGAIATAVVLASS